MDKELLRTAFMAGRDNEANNNNPDFDEWFSKNMVDFECVDCGDRILRERHDMDIAGIDPSRCYHCVAQRMAER